MKHVRSIRLALFCVLTCAVAALAQAQQPSTAAAPRAQQRNLIIGVLNVADAIASHPVITDDMPALAEKGRLEEIEYGKVQQEIQEKSNKLQQEYKVGTPEYEEQIDSLRKQLADAQIKLQKAYENLQAQRTQCMFRAYKDLQAAVQQVATQNGILIVHTKVKVAAPENANVSEEVVALQEAENNLVIWNRPECDITEQVKNALAANVGVSKQASASSPLSNLGNQALNVAGAPAAQPRANVQTPLANPAQNQLAPRAAANPVAPRR